jgi:hypothetical protein
MPMIVDELDWVPKVIDNVLDVISGVVKILCPTDLI